MSLTKICNFLLVIFLSVSFFSSCSNAEPKVQTPTKKERQRRAAKKAKAKKASNKNSYWSELKQATGITDKQQQSLIRIAAKYDKQRKAVPKVKGKPDRKKMNRINFAQAKEVKKVLGQELHTKKRAFDKRWKAKSRK